MSDSLFSMPPDLWTEPIIRSPIDRYFHSADEGIIRPTIVLVLVEAAPQKNHHPGLVKMMAACQIPTPDYHIIYMQENNGWSWPTLASTFQPDYVIAFGGISAILGIQAQFAPLESYWFHNRVWMQVMRFDDFIINEAWKNSFWKEVLQDVFFQGKYQRQLACRS